MLKYKLIFFFFLASCFTVSAQSVSDSIPKKPQLLSIGISPDYLKLHTLLLDESEKWEAAVNLTLLEKVSFVGEYGIAKLTPEDAYKNAVYISEGSYFRVGADYHLTVIPSNYLLFGIRYSRSTYDESIDYTSENPIFPNTSGSVDRSSLTAQWFELVISSEKKVKRLFKKDIPDFLSLGFRLRLKSYLDYEEFEIYETKEIPGYGMTNTSLNPEINLYLKFKINLL